MDLGEELPSTGIADAYFDKAFVHLSARERWCADRACEMYRGALAIADKVKIDRVDNLEDRAAIIANRWARNVLWYAMPYERRRKILELRKQEKEARREGEPHRDAEPTVDYGAAARA